eukprot:6936511-Pyramimonas_sp.AAC.1
MAGSTLQKQNAVTIGGRGVARGLLNPSRDHFISHLLTVLADPETMVERVRQAAVRAERRDGEVTSGHGVRGRPSRCRCKQRPS